MRNLIAIVLGLLLIGCSVKSHNPKAQVDIRVPVSVQVEVMDATKAYGKRHGFLYAEGDFMLGNRRVSQLRMERNDGAVISMSNFNSPDTIEAVFYAEKQGADWEDAKKSWLEEIRVILNGRGEIIDVPVGPPPHLLNEERMHREAMKVNKK